jgi:hypothetical protein
LQDHAEGLAEQPLLVWTQFLSILEERVIDRPGHEVIGGYGSLQVFLDTLG